MFIRKLFFAVAAVFLTAGFAQASVDVYIDDLNLYASKKFGSFRTEISARYGISGSRFDLMLNKVDSPGDLAVALWIGFKSQQSIDTVIKKSRLHRGQGWGVIAKELGIKPGSPAFKTLKAGTIDWHPKDFAEVVKKDDEKKAEIDKRAEYERRKKEAYERKQKKRQERTK